METSERYRIEISPERLSRVINICDNVFYNNYLTTGVLNSREEIQSRIKNQVTDTFVEFWGESHSQKIQEKINSTELTFSYQSIGHRNSIEKFLEQTKIEQFNKKHGSCFNDPQSIEYVSRELSQNGNNLRLLLETSNSYYMDCCLQQLGETKDKLMNDDSLLKLVVSQINELGMAWNTTKYSDNLKINEDMLFLENYVKDVNYNALEKICDLCESRGIKDKDAQVRRFVEEKVIRDGVWWYDYNLDPLAKKEDKSLHTNSSVEAFYNPFKRKVHLGIVPSDNTILHEYIHVVDGCGFEKGHFENGATEYSKQFRKHEQFNEVVTDYFAKLMCDQRKRSGKEAIVNLEYKDSIYGELFDVMGGFIETYLTELKEIRLREYPSEEFMRIIGKEQFDDLGVLCNETIALNHDKNICEMAEKEGLSVDDFLLETGYSMYGSSKTSLIDIKDKLDFSREGFEKTKDNAFASQSRLKRLGMYLRDKTQSLSEKLDNEEKPHLSRFSKLLQGASNKIENITQKHVKRSLDDPIESIDMENDNEMVMTRENLSGI